MFTESKEENESSVENKTDGVKKRLSFNLYRNLVVVRYIIEGMYIKLVRGYEHVYPIWFITSVGVT